MLINSLLLIIFILRFVAYCPYLRACTLHTDLYVYVSFAHVHVNINGTHRWARLIYVRINIPLNFSICPSVKVFALNMNLKLGALIDSCLCVISQPLELGQFWFMAAPSRAAIHKQINKRIDIRCHIILRHRHALPQAN